MTARRERMDTIPWALSTEHCKHAPLAIQPIIILFAIQDHPYDSFHYSKKRKQKLVYTSTHITIHIHHHTGHNQTTPCREKQEREIVDRFICVGQRQHCLRHTEKGPTTAAYTTAAAAYCYIYCCCCRCCCVQSTHWLATPIWERRESMPTKIQPVRNLGLIKKHTSISLVLPNLSFLLISSYYIYSTILLYNSSNIARGEFVHACCMHCCYSQYVYNAPDQRMYEYDAGCKAVVAHSNNSISHEITASS